MNRFDRFYAGEKLAFGEKPSEYLSDLVNGARASGRALDIGAGDGRNSLYLAQVGFDVTAIDTSQVGLDKLERLARSRGLAAHIHTETADARTATYAPGTYALIAAVTLFDHLRAPDVPPLFERLTASLVDGGLLFVKAHTVDDPGHSEDRREASELAGEIHHYFERNELLRLAADRFYIIRYEETREHDTSHGRPHYHAFAKMLARKYPFDANNLPLFER